MKVEFEQKVQSYKQSVEEEEWVEEEKKKRGKNDTSRQDGIRKTP